MADVPDPVPAGHLGAEPRPVRRSQRLSHLEQRDRPPRRDVQRTVVAPRRGNSALSLTAATSLTWTKSRRCPPSSNTCGARRRPAGYGRSRQRPHTGCREASAVRRRCGIAAHTPPTPAPVRTPGTGAPGGAWSPHRRCGGRWRGFGHDPGSATSPQPGSPVRTGRHSRSATSRAPGRRSRDRHRCSGPRRRRPCTTPPRDAHATRLVHRPKHGRSADVVRIRRSHRCRPDPPRGRPWPPGARPHPRRRAPRPDVGIAHVAPSTTPHGSTTRVDRRAQQGPGCRSPRPRGRRAQSIDQVRPDETCPARHDDPDGCSPPPLLCQHDRHA